MIDDLLDSKLFTNDIINKIVCLIYPILTKLANEQIVDLLKNLIGTMGEGAVAEP